MNPSDDWILEQLPSSCPEMALEWMRQQGIPPTDEKYQHFKNVINRKMKIMAKYDMARWNYQTAPRTGAKIWVRI